MKIIFKQLQKKDFSLLLKWLKSPHVKTFWDPNTQWTEALISEKYDSYIKGYKIEKNNKKKISAFIIEADEYPIGYIQAYNAYDFPRTAALENLPLSLAAFDLFIGEASHLKQGIGTLALIKFLEDILKKEYDFVFADPDRRNTAAIKLYTKAGFVKIHENLATQEIWMIKKLSG